MFLRAFLISITLLAGGCGYNAGERLLGAWEGRESDGSRMLMVFQPDGKLTVAAGSERGSGTYFLHEKSAPLGLDLSFQLGTTPITAKSILVFLSSDQIKLAQPTPERPSDFSGKVLILNRRLQ
jgi:hypothetical protein